MLIIQMKFYKSEKKKMQFSSNLSESYILIKYRMVKGHIRFIYLGVSTNVDILMHNSLVSLEEFLVLVRSPAPLTLGLLVVVDLVGVGVQLHLVLEDLAALGAGDSLGGGVDAVLVFPERGPVPHLGKTDLALDWLDLVNIVDMIPGGQLPTNRTDLLPVIPSLMELQVSD